MGDVTVPDEFDEWPFDAKRFVLAEANTVAGLREAIDGIVGLDSDEWLGDSANQFTKDQLAAVLMALGGPERGEA